MSDRIVDIETLDTTHKCHNVRDVLKSPDFSRGLEIIMENRRMYNSDYYLPIFEKLWNWETLDSQEESDLRDFLNDKMVQESWQRILSSLFNSQVEFWKTKVEEVMSWVEFIKKLSSENWFEWIKAQILNILKQWSNEDEWDSDKKKAR